MRILLISPYFRPMVGGVETHLDDLCRYFNSKNHTVFVRTYKAMGQKNRGLSDEKVGSVHIHRMWWPDFNLIFTLDSYPLLKFLYIFIGTFFDNLLFLLTSKQKIDVIQVHGFIAAVAGVILAKLFSKKLVVNTHVGFKFDNPGLMTNVIKLVLKNADKILVLTNNAKEGLIKIGVDEQKIIIYHYWVDQNIFKPQTGAKKKLGWDNKFVVLFVGRLIEVKGVRSILEIARKLPNILFVIAGSGPLSEELEVASKKHNNVLFLGKINNQDLPTYYNGADLLIIPSKIIEQEYEEGIPRVMIEALSCGTPVITTPSGGIPDVFTDQIGRMVGDNVAAFVEVIKSVADNKSLQLELSDHTRRFASKIFSLKNAKVIENSLKDI